MLLISRSLHQLYSAVPVIQGSLRHIPCLAYRRHHLLNRCFLINFFRAFLKQVIRIVGMNMVFLPQIIGQALCFHIQGLRITQQCMDHHRFIYGGRISGDSEGFCHKNICLVFCWIFPCPVFMIRQHLNLPQHSCQLDFVFRIPVNIPAML